MVTKQLKKKIKKILRGTQVGVQVEYPPKFKAWAKKDLPGHIREAEP